MVTKVSRKKKLIGIDDIDLSGWNHRTDSRVPFTEEQYIFYKIVKYLEDKYPEYVFIPGGLVGISTSRYSNITIYFTKKEGYMRNGDTAIPNGVLEIALSVCYMGFPHCCGMGIMSHLAIHSHFRVDHNLINVAGEVFKEAWRRKLVTKVIYTISDQEANWQEKILRTMGFYNYAEPFISCRTSHRLTTLVLDAYPEIRMKEVETQYNRLYKTKSIYR